jgi:Flp pilus assembly protein TadG
MRSEPRRGARDGGMVTAELAACLPVLVLVLGVALTAVSVVAARVRLEDAAREAVRATARGDAGSGRALAARLAPDAEVGVERHGATVEVVVRQRVRPLGGWLPGFTVVERAVAAVEPRPGTGPAVGVDPRAGPP